MTMQEQRPAGAVTKLENRLTEIRATDLYKWVYDYCYNALIDSNRNEVLDNALRIAHDITYSIEIKLSQNEEEILLISSVDVWNNLAEAGLLTDLVDGYKVDDNGNRVHDDEEIDRMYA